MFFREVEHLPCLDRCGLALAAQGDASVISDAIEWEQWDLGLSVSSIAKLPDCNSCCISLGLYPPGFVLAPSSLSCWQLP